MAQITFDASGVTPETPRELLPPDRYPVQIVQSEMRATKTGNGQLLWLELDVLDGPHQGRKIWDQLNLVNPSQQTVEIAQRALSAICHAVGQLQVNDSEQLHLRPLEVTLAVELDSRDKHLPPQDRRKQNKVKGYAALGNTLPARATAAPATPPRAAPPPPRQAPAPTTTTPPWRRAG